MKICALEEKRDAKWAPTKGKAAVYPCSLLENFPCKYPSSASPQVPIRRTTAAGQTLTLPTYHSSFAVVPHTASLLLFLSLHLLAQKDSPWVYLASWHLEASLGMLRGLLGDVLELRDASKVGISLLLRSREQLIPPVKPVSGGITCPSEVPVSPLTREQPAADQTPIFQTVKPLSLILILPLIQAVRSWDLL